MRRVFALLLCAILTSACALGGKRAQERPNILVIVADDLGYSDIGAFGGEIETPNLDALARRGVRFTDFHTAAACSPTRAMLLTGANPHRVGYATMAGDQTPAQLGQPGYEAFLNSATITIPQLLRDSGYLTVLSGKWDMGGRRDEALWPNQRGFEESFALIEGAADHFEALPALEEHDRPTYVENGARINLPPDFYSSRTYAERMAAMLHRHQHEERPFFAYLAFTAPHWPLQAPAETIARYEARYAAGYDTLRAARIARMREIGIIGDAPPAARNPLIAPAWEELTPEMRQLETRRMAIYAAMVEEMDRAIGVVLDQLRATGELDNTLVVFMSDNGPEGSNPLDWGWYDWAESSRDLSVANMGGRRSYAWQGPGWGQVSATPFSYFKFFAHEGGTRAPAIVAWPEHAQRGASEAGFASVLDLAATIVDAAGAEHPNGASYNGAPTLPLEGRSLTPVLSGRTDEIRPDLPMVWELYNRRAVRLGDWKIVSANRPWGSGAAHWQLYNVERDPAEQHDLAAEHPQHVSRLNDIFEQYRRANGLILDDAFAVPPTNTDSHYRWLPPEMRHPGYAGPSASREPHRIDTMN